MLSRNEGEEECDKVVPGENEWGRGRQVEGEGDSQAIDLNEI